MIRAIRGCDTGAFLLQIRAMIQSGKNYHYVLKLHTKSNHPIFPHWRENLLDPIAGSREAVKTVFKTFRNKRSAGMIGCRRWRLSREINFDYFHQICQRYQIHTNGHFIGGTIFWVRFRILRRFFTKVAIEKEYELCELGKPSEPSYTHAWERIYGLITETSGGEILGI
jgi:lipopolysaccharide biosynthesis protein